MRVRSLRAGRLNDDLLSHQQRSAEFSRDQFRTCTRYRFCITVMYEGEEEVLPEWPATDLIDLIDSVINAPNLPSHTLIDIMIMINTVSLAL